MLDLLSRLAVRATLVGGSLLERRLFWVRAALGKNQLQMHRCTPDGEISIGGVSEQLYGEGFVAAWHEVLGRELGPRLPEVLYEVGVKGARWEVNEAIARGEWVPALLRSLVGKPELLEKVRASSFTRALVEESFGILFRMIMTEGGWGRVLALDLDARPMKVVVANTPESRRLGKTEKAQCHLMTGIYAGYFATLFGVPFSGKETTCRCAGDDHCTFELAPQAVEATKVETVSVGAGTKSEKVGSSAR
jgi:predicted hydrocarbon binding protein